MAKWLAKLENRQKANLRTAKWRARPEVQIHEKIVNRERRNQKRKIILEAKAQPCVDCGQSFHFSAMDFDHVRGKKRFNISQASMCSEETLRAEIAKCDVACANCHRVRTYKRNHPGTACLLR